MAIKLPQSPGGRLALGLGLAALAQSLTIFLSGSGEGWNTPMFVSVILWVIAPFSLYAVGQRPAPSALLIALALIGLGADAILIKGTVAEANVFPMYLHVNGAAGLAIIAAWLFLWLLWQVLVSRALVAGRAGHRE